MPVKVLVVALIAQIAMGAAFVFVAARGFPVIGGSPPSERPATSRELEPPRPRADAFDEDRAWAELKRQVALGPRPAGSPASRRLARRLRRLLPRGRFERVPGGLRNVIGRLPGRRPAVLVGAHYDTKDLPGFVGANDGAGGTAAVVELARALRRARRPPGAPELRFVLFDGEESPDDSAPFYSTGLRGSRRHAAAHADELRAVVVLDFVADRHLSLPREAGSDPRLWARLRAAAARTGVAAAFPPRTVGEVLDDHTPFARRGVPAIDLIDFEYPHWHRPSDDLRAVSRESLDVAGEAVFELLASWR